MSVFSPLTSRRSSNRKVKPTQQLIVFRLRNEGFALPIRASLKVIPLGEVFGAPQTTGVGLTLYQEQELLVIDIGQRIFKGLLTQPAIPSSEPSEPSESPPPSGTIEGSYLLIVQSSSRKLVGLPLLEPPSLQRVPESAFAPLTSDYLAYGTIRCVSALVIQGNEQPPLFLLNPDLLVQPQSALPPTLEQC
jgi:chemotaxis signal transduction protein